MHKPSRIGTREIKALQPYTMIWDSTVVGFGARRQKTASVTYVLFYRTREGRQRWMTIGHHGSPWTPDAARDQARKLLGEVAHGGDPAAEKRKARNAKTVSELCDLYLEDADSGRLLTKQKVPKKPSTLISDRGRIARHIKPLLGHRRVNAVTRDDINEFLHAIARGESAGRVWTKPRGVSNVRGGNGTASRTVGLLGGIFSFAVLLGLRADNPVHGVVRFADGRRDRRLSDDEYRALGQSFALAKAKGIPSNAVAVAHFLALTGWRTGEAL